MTSTVWGLGGPPRHEDGRAVITARLASHMTPLEIEMYSGNDLARRIGRSVQWKTKGEPIDGWDPEDFVQYGLAEAARYDWATPAAVVTWVSRKIDRVRRRADRAPVLEVNPEGSEFRPTILPEEISAWVSRSLPPVLATAVRLVVEQGLTPAQAADSVGVTTRRVQRAFERLRRKA